MRAKGLLAAVVALAWVLTSPVAASAEGKAQAFVSGVDYSRGVVSVSVRYEEPVSEVGLVAGGSVLGTSACAPQDREVLAGEYRLRSGTSLDVVGFDASQTPVWATTIALDPADYRPKKPKLKVASDKVVAPKWTVWGTAFRSVTKVKVRFRGSSKSTTIAGVPGNKGGFKLSGLNVPFGSATLSMVASNGFGVSPTSTIRVYNLGTGLPRSARYEFVSKRILWMFDVKSGRVVHAWPVAIGTRQTPTPVGTFRIGTSQRSGGDWGVLRRPLMRVRNGRRYRTGYYIHGTNAPWSIGMMASHGCVRMYNTHVRQFSRYVPTGTIVRIE